MAAPTAIAESCTKGTSCGWPSAPRRARLGASAGGLSPNRWAVAGVRSVYMAGIEQECHALRVVQRGTHQDMIAHELDRDSTAHGR